MVNKDVRSNLTQLLPQSLNICTQAMGVGLPHVGFKQCQLMLGAVEGFSQVGTPATTFDSSFVGLAHFT